jgi:hypothetical protein
MVLDTVRTVYAERMDMAQALEDTAAIIMSLEICLSILLQAIMVAFHLLVRGPPVTDGVIRDSWLWELA